MSRRIGAPYAGPACPCPRSPSCWTCAASSSSRCPARWPRCCARLYPSRASRPARHGGHSSTQDREHDRVPPAAVGPADVPAEHALAGRAELGDRGLRPGVDQVGLQLDPAEAAVVERVDEQRELAGRVDRRAPPAAARTPSSPGARARSRGPTRPGCWCRRRCPPARGRSRRPAGRRTPGAGRSSAGRTAPARPARPSTSAHRPAGPPP